MDEKMNEVAEWLYQMRESGKEMTEKELMNWEILQDELAEW